MNYPELILNTYCIFINETDIQEGPSLFLSNDLQLQCTESELAKNYSVLRSNISTMANANISI